MAENSIHHTPSPLTTTAVQASTSAAPSQDASVPSSSTPSSSTPSSAAPSSPVLSAETGQFSSQKAGTRLFFTTFFTTFITIFAAEIGDKTQVTTLLISAESQAPWVVFAGAGMALVLTTLLGVSVGRWLARHVAIETLETITAVILLMITLLLLGDVIQM